MRDYQIASPSLEGVLNHDSLLYEGIKRPLEILRILDGPASKGRESDAKGKKTAVSGSGKSTELVVSQVPKMKIGSNSELTESEFKILQEYFYDLYGVFMKKLSYFLVESSFESDDSVKLQAMLQEMIKVRRWVIGK
ncbi:MAG: hypothetical protein WCP09_01660 [Candidatus Taylorbacteria bacterium]